MVKVKQLLIDGKTGKSKVVEREIELPTPSPEPEGIDLEDIKKLIAYAKAQGWI